MDTYPVEAKPSRPSLKMEAKQMTIAVLLLIVAIAVTYLAHIQRKTVEVQAALINHLVDIVSNDSNSPEPHDADKMRDIITKAHSLPS